MYDPKFTDFLGQMWRKLDEQQFVYVVVVKNAIPYIVAPGFVDRESYLDADQQESLIMLFTQEKDAEDWGQVILDTYEANTNPKPKLNVTRMTMGEISDAIEELNVLSNQEFGCPVRIDIAQSYPDDNDVMVGTDVLYSKYRLAN